MLCKIKRETLYVPPSMRAADLLVRMQANRIHMAMVIDEFGGLDGLVTLEDVLEGVVGEIDDEHDEAQIIQIIDKGGLPEVDAHAPLEALEAALKTTLTTEDMDTEDIDTHTHTHTTTLAPSAVGGVLPVGCRSAARSSPIRPASTSRSPTLIPGGSSTCACAPPLRPRMSDPSPTATRVWIPRALSTAAGALLALAQPPFGFLPGLLGWTAIMVLLDRASGSERRCARPSCAAGWLAAAIS